MVDPRRLVGAARRRVLRTVRARSGAARRARPRSEWSLGPAAGRAGAVWWASEVRRVTPAVDAVIAPLDAAARGDIAVVCVTNRPEQAEHVCATLLAQADVGVLRAVVVLNDEIGDGSVFEQRLTSLELTVLHLAPPVSLGACLNAGWDIAGRRYVAKIDDDDVYGPHYVRDAVRVLRWSPAAVVGKHTYLARLSASATTVLRFPGHEWRPTGFVAGGTIVADTSRTRSARFGDSTTGEDTAFLAAVERGGGLVLATSALDFVQTRHGANTWQVSDDGFAAQAVDLGGDDLAPWVTRGMAPADGTAI